MAGRKNKLITKAAAAKKVLKKNIKANTKITFNELGEVGVTYFHNYRIFDPSLILYFN